MRISGKDSDKFAKLSEISVFFCGFVKKSVWRLTVFSWDLHKIALFAILRKFAQVHYLIENTWKTCFDAKNRVFEFE